MQRKITALLLALILVIALSACAQKTDPITQDRQGNPITLPGKIEKVMVSEIGRASCRERV